MNLINKKCTEHFEYTNTFLESVLCLVLRIFIRVRIAYMYVAT